MSRALKRPMFKRGGQVNDGIMTGLTDRKQYAEGPSQYEIDLRKKTELYNKLLNEYAPIPKTKLPLGQFGLNLASGKFAGDGKLQNLIGSAQGPYAQFTKADDARKAAMANRKASAVSVAMKDMADDEKLRKQLQAQKDLYSMKQDPTRDLKNIYLKKSIDDGYDLPEAQRIADYQLTTKTDLQAKVGRNRVAGLLNFDLSDTTQLKKQLPKLKDKVGMYFFDPYDGKIKLLTNKNGVLGFEEFNSVAEITFKKPDDASPTIEADPIPNVFSPEIADAMA